MPKRRKRGRRKQPFKLKLKKDTIYSVASTLLIIIGGLIIISFSKQGVLLTAIFEIFSDVFGWGVLLLPFLFIISGLMLAKLSWAITRPNVFVGSLVTFISLIGLTTAGRIGKEIWNSLKSLITGFGAALILLGGAGIGLMVLFESSLADVLVTISNLTKSFKKIFSKKPSWATSGNLGKKLTVKGMTEKKEDQQLKLEEAVKEQKGKDETTLSTQPVTNVPGAANKVWDLPPLSILSDSIGGKADRGDLKKNASIIEKTLDSFGIQARVVEVNCGPAVTQYALEIALGTKLSKITALANDLALALAAPTGQIRIEAPIPGRSLVGAEIPNRSLEFVTLKQMLKSNQMHKSKSRLTVALGLDVSGKPVVADLARMPHVLIAGATGSGKSVAINSFIASLLFRASPSEVKLILVDPKRVELTQYNRIPHLLTPVIVEPEKVVAALKWAISEMERRYKLFAEAGARNIDSYNELSGFQALPYLVIIVDELADIMFFAPSEVEDTVTRLAQMARATGIHLVLSTQRPSVDVITGLIKANIPCRIAFNVSSMVDSRVIIDMPGAEKLLGRGDMLYIPPEQAKPTRIQGAFVAENETRKLIEFLQNTGIKPQYTEEVTTKYPAKSMTVPGAMTEEVDEFFDEAVRLVCRDGKASASLLQRRLSIGYARAARILDQLQIAGVVGPSEGSKPRELFIKNAEEFLAKRKAAEASEN